MKFTKEFLVDLIDDEEVTVYDKITGTGRWSTNHERVFRHEGKFYKTHYRVGSTESQDEGPYEYEKGEIECPEVFAVEKTITAYETR